MQIVSNGENVELLSAELAQRVVKVKEPNKTKLCGILFYFFIQTYEPFHWS